VASIDDTTDHLTADSVSTSVLAGQGVILRSGDVSQLIFGEELAEFCQFQATKQAYTL